MEKAVRGNDRVNCNVWRALSVLAALAAVVGLTAAAQVAPKVPDAQTPTPLSVERASAGDSPDDPGPLATNLSPALTHEAIRKAAQKVAD